MPELELFGSTNCPFTEEMRESLHWEKQQFTEYCVDEDAEAFDRLLELTGKRNVPVLVEDGRVKQVGWQGRTCLAATPRKR